MIARVIAGVLERIVENTCLKLFQVKHQQACPPENGAACVTEAGALCKATLLSVAEQSCASNDTHSHASCLHAEEKSPALHEQCMRTHHDANDVCGASNENEVKGVPAPLEMIGSEPRVVHVHAYVHVYAYGHVYVYRTN